MHEYSVALEIIRLAEEYCRAQKGISVKEIILAAGENCGYLPESIELYFDIIAQGSLCEQARLSVIRIPSKLKCTGCGGLFLRKPFSFSCPDCGGDAKPTDIGREFYIESVKIVEKE